MTAPVTILGPWVAECSGKRSYTQKKAAKLAAKQANARFGGARVHAYKCGTCGKFHVGHQPRWSLEEIEQDVISTQESGTYVADTGIQPTTTAQES